MAKKKVRSRNPLPESKFRMGERVVLARPLFARAELGIQGYPPESVPKMGDEYTIHIPYIVCAARDGEPTRAYIWYTVRESKWWTFREDEFDSLRPNNPTEVKRAKQKVKIQP